MLEYRPVGRTNGLHDRQRKCREANERQARRGEGKGHGNEDRTDRTAQEEHCPAIVLFVVCVGVDAFMKVGRSRQSQRPKQPQQHRNGRPGKPDAAVSVNPGRRFHASPKALALGRKLG